MGRNVSRGITPQIYSLRSIPNDCKIVLSLKKQAENTLPKHGASILGF
jgi:hypothetical protein